MNKIFTTLVMMLVCLSASSTEKRFAFDKGVNISHWLSQSNQRGEARATYFTRDDVARIASLGFDHIRIPVDEEQMFNAEGEKEVEAFTLLHNALRWCTESKLRAVVDLHILRSHHFNDQVKPLFTDAKAQEQFYTCWRQLSDELKKYPLDMLAYELMNEPVADEPQIWNKIVNRCAEIVRGLEPERKIIIGSNRWQSYETVKDLQLPENDPNIIISFHYYNPFLLTHYRASWTDNKNYLGPVHYPGKLIADADMAGLSDDERKNFGWANNQHYDINKIEADFREVLKVAEAKGLQVYCGEYGCIDACPAEDANRWFRDMNILFNRHGIASAVWDYKGGFGIIKKGEIYWPMIEAITGLTHHPVPFGDPFIMLHEDKYYAYGTSSPDGIRVYVSDDLITWTEPEKSLVLHKDDVWADRFFWAPEVYYRKGRFYMYYSADEHICAATSDSPLGPFRQEVKKPMIADEKCIDNSLFIDDDGKPYLFFDRFNDGLNICVAELEDNLIEIKRKTPHPCIHVSQPWEEVLPRVNEGSFVVKHKGVYYMTYSANGYTSPFYGIGFATATKINGVWTKYEQNPIYQNVGSLAGIGHSAMFTDREGNLRIVFHSHNSKQKIHPRTMHISEVRFVEKNGKTVMEIDPNYITPQLNF